MSLSWLRRYRLVILASPLLVFPVWQYSLMSGEVAGMVEDQGVVVDHIEVQPLRGFPRYHSVIEYSGTSGNKLRFVDPVYKRPPETIGKSVSILVDPVNRLRVHRAGFYGFWNFFGITTLLSLTFFFMAAGATYFSRRSLRHRAKRMHKRKGKNEA